MRHLRYHRHLDGGCEQLAKPPHRPFRSRFRRRRQVKHNSCLCSGVCAKEHSRRSHDDVADVDRLRHYGWIRIVGGFPGIDDFWREHTVALDDGLYIDPAFHCHVSGLSLPRESPLVSCSHT